MILDTTFLSDFFDQEQAAQNFWARHRSDPFRITVISVGEMAVIFPNNAAARAYLNPFRCYRLTPEIAYAAAALDRELRNERLGENDNWIAGFCRYYGEALVSRDRAFDRVPGLRRIPY